MDRFVDDLGDFDFYLHVDLLCLSSYNPLTKGNNSRLCTYITQGNKLVSWEMIHYQSVVIFRSISTIVMKRFDTPFVHYTIENYLDQATMAQVASIYNHLQFFEKESDLFHFFQTNELADEPSLSFLKDKLNCTFGQLCSLKDTSYNIFASMYFKGDYLLCHDDVVDDRKYAFCYYLEDHPSADLVLYDETATKQVKRVKVKKNLLVIFEVSNISYHEVAMAKQNNRKAITGWLNKKGQGAQRPKKIIPPYQPTLPKNMIKFDFNQFITDEEYFSVPDMEYIFDIVNRTSAGPVYERKATRLQLSQCVVLDMKGYSLYSADFLHFAPGDYMLLNDPVNLLGEGVLDVFIMQLPNGDTDIEKFFINIIDENGQIEGGIPYMNDTMFLVQRGKKNYYIDVAEEDVYVGHLIYRRTKDKKQKPREVEQSQVKQIRAKLLKNNMEDIKKLDEAEAEMKKEKKKKQIKKEEKGKKATKEESKGKKEARPQKTKVKTATANRNKVKNSKKPNRK